MDSGAEEEESAALSSLLWRKSDLSVGDGAEDGGGGEADLGEFHFGLNGWKEGEEEGEGGGEGEVENASMAGEMRWGCEDWASWRIMRESVRAVYLSYQVPLRTLGTVSARWVEKKNLGLLRV